MQIKNWTLKNPYEDILCILFAFFTYYFLYLTNLMYVIICSIHFFPQEKTLSKLLPQYLEMHIIVEKALVSQTISSSPPSFLFSIPQSCLSFLSHSVTLFSLNLMKFFLISKHKIKNLELFHYFQIKILWFRY